MITKERQLAYRGRKYVKPVYEHIPEAMLQHQMDDMLKAMRIEFRRFPDGFFRWLKMNAPAGIQRWFFGMFGGIEDNTCFIPVNDKYSLACHIELKSDKGKLHGKQKHMVRRLPVQISRSPDESIAIVQRYQADAERIRQAMAEMGL